MASSIASSARFGYARAIAGVVFAALVLVSHAARAEPDERDLKLAQSLFDRARALMDEGRFPEACPLLAESQRLDPGGGTLLNLAVCLERAGKLASAHATYHEALSQAIKEGRDERRRIATEAIASLSPRLSTITVDVPATARVPGMVVWLDGAKLAEVAWGVPTAVDGGDHRIEATAPDRAAWFTVQSVAPERASVRVEVHAPPPLFVPIPPAPPPPPPLPHCAPGTRLESGRCIAEPRTVARFSTASWVVGGASVVLAGVAVGTGVTALVLNTRAKNDAINEGCNLARDYCPAGRAPDAIATASRSHVLGWVATASAIGSGVTLLTALLLPRQRVVITMTGGATFDAGWLGARGSF